MKFYSYNSPIFNDDGKLIGNEVVTMSEDDIREQYYPYWREQMVKKFGEKYVEENNCIYDCIDDWIVVHWAWEST